MTYKNKLLSICGIQVVKAIPLKTYSCSVKQSDESVKLFCSCSHPKFLSLLRLVLTKVLKSMYASLISFKYDNVNSVQPKPNRTYNLLLTIPTALWSERPVFETSYLNLPFQKIILLTILKVCKCILSS